MEDEEYKKLPVEEKCVHKLWKARVNGYEEVTKLFRQIDDEKSPEFGKYLGLVRKFVADSNAMGQEKGLEATLAYVENYAYAGKTVSEVVSAIVLKCIAAPKTKTRELALQVVLMYVEIEKQEAVVEELVKGMEQKNPKIVAACIMAATTALREFGSKIVNVKPLVKKITPLFADRDKTVRDEARQMVVEIFRWIGAALRSQLNNLQPVQITELEAEFVKIEGQKAIPTRYVRSQQQKQATINNAGADEVVDDGAADEGEDVGDAPQIDPYELADPVDILGKLPKDFYEKIEAKKWQDRKEALEVVETLVKTPKLENGDYGDLVRALKKVVQKDSNVVVVALAGRCIASLAAGLKKRFGTYAGACVPALLEKFKEKKQNVVTAMREAVDAVYLTTNIEAILDDAVEAMGNKNPSVKLETSFFLARAFSKTNPTVLNKKILKALTTGLCKNINEPDPGVRDSAAEALGTLMKLVGEKAIGPFLVDLEKDNLKMTKIRECCEKAVITVKASGGGGGGGGAKKGRPTTAPAKPAAKTAAPVRSASQSGSATITKKKAPDASRSAPAVSKAKGGGGKAAASSKGAGATKTAPERELGDEEVDEIVSAIINESIRNDMVDANWKARLEAAKNFLNELQTQDALPAQALVRTVVRKPGLKDTNFQVLKAKLDIVKYVAEKSSKFSTTTANCCMNDIAEKFGDAKNGVLVAETMTAIAEATSLGFVSTVVLENAAGQKNPKVLQEALTWLSEAIKEFGFASLNAKFLIETAKKALASTNPGVRQSAIAFCGVLYLYMGNPIHMFFENEKPILREQITTEFNKYEGESPPAPTRGVVHNAASTNSLDALEDDGGEIESVPSTAINVQDLMPRVDISGQLTDALIAEVEDKNWKVRNEALIKISAILQEAKFIKPNLGDLPVPLSHRLSDSNTKIAQSALNICEAIAKAMGPPCKQHIRTFFPCFLQSLGDNKNWMRTTAIDTINAYADQCGYKEFFEAEMIADALKSGSPMLRIELWAWLGEKLPKIPVKVIPKEELTACIPHLYSNLEDRNVDVRKNAQEAVLGVMMHLGYENMAKHTEKLSLGSKKVVVAALDKARPNLPLKPLPTKKPSVEKEDKAVRGTRPAANSKTAVKSKGSASSAKTAPVGSGRKKDEDLDTSPLLVVSNLKHQRMIDESKLKVLKWNFTAPREEFVEQLNLQMATANVNKTLMFNMFHNDFRYHIKAIESLMDDVPTNGPAIISNLDLILKWLTLRFFDTNPSVLLKGFEFLHLVFNMLIDEKYHMLENEAASFLPYLIVKIGDPKDSVRNGVRSLFKQMYFVYPIGRLFSYIMDGLKSKNARQRAECLDAMGSMIQDYGVTVCSPGPGQCLKEVAKQISDRDNSVRNAALNCVVEAYNIIGDKVYKMVGNISDKDLSLLEERIKRSSRRTMLKPPAKIDPVTGIPQSPQREHESRNGIGDGMQHQQHQQQPEPEMAEQEEEEEEARLPPVIMPTLVQKEITGPYRLDPDLLHRLDNIPVMPNLNQVQQFDLDFLNNDVNMQVLKNFSARARTMPLSPPKPLDLNLPNLRKNLNVQWPSPKKQEPVLARNIQQMTSTDINMAIQAIEQVIDFLQTSKSSVMLDFENDFMSAIVTQLRQLRPQDPRTDANVSKIYRSLLTVIDAFYRNKSLGKNVSMEVLKDIINELITLLVDEKLDACTDGDAYVRVVNLQCVKFIERSDHSRVICALVKLIHECVRHDMPTRHTDLVMKCLWRVIKQMPQREEVDYDMVLLYVHNFLKEFPTSWWKTKPLDTTLRTIKTILHSTVKIKGGSIMMHLGKIPNPSESEVESYLLKLLKTMKVDEIKQLPLKQETHQRRSLTKATHTTLTEIFQKIGNKEETKEGITLLYDFLEQHPEADIDPFLKKSSQFFQDYIQNGLQEIRNTRKSIPEKMQQLKPGKTLDTASDEELKEFQKGPEYWMKKLNMYKKMIDDVDKRVYES